MQYRTIQNDRWDQISIKFYGQADYYKDIIKANPLLPDGIKNSSLLPAGVILDIPALDPTPTYPQELPPWEQ